jgi:hypothetical protein
LNRESPWRRGARDDDERSIEAVKMSQAGHDSVFADAMSIVRAHLRRARVRA